MLIKNVCSRVLKLEDFPSERPLAPGAITDLSKYPIADREASAQLKDLFTKGLLMCLGYAPIDPHVKAAMGTKTSLSKHLITPESLYQNDVIIPPKSMQPMVTTGRNKNEMIAKVATTPQRYNAAALEKYRLENEQANEDILPKFEEKEFTPVKTPGSFVQIQADDEVNTISLDELTGTMYVQDAPGFVKKDFTKDPSVFVDKHVYHEDTELDERRAKLKDELRDKINKKIVEMVNDKCLAPKGNGTPCSLPVAKGFNNCWMHLSKEEKKKALAQRKSGLSK